ncbi:MAG: hypothetical protein DMF37_00800 [Verrucomicrobia bacterium]|nr:MAG: hypothetical protein DMF37_00800 [Verrucomicrobiota bacterium]
MADDDKRKFNIPWATLLPLIAVLGGIVAQYKPLVSTRPRVPSEKPVPVLAKQDVDARLWQDPIGVAQKQKSVVDAQLGAAATKNGTSELHDIHALVELLHKRATDIPDQERILLLAVMLDAGPYSEQGESRLRARQAVLEGLSESGFVPVDGEHIGFVTAAWPPSQEGIDGMRPKEGALLLPWEECEAMDDPARVYPRNTRCVVIVWLPAVSFNPYPLSRFANIVDQLAGDIRHKIDIKLIGPANSTGLQNMIREVRAHTLRTKEQDSLKEISIVSPSATASDETMLFEPSPPDEATEVRSAWGQKTVQMYLEEAVPGLKFLRTIATDDVVLEKLIAELARRRVEVLGQTTRNTRQLSKPAHVVILFEWDTPYGRSLGATFAMQASGQSINEIIQQPEKRPRWIHSYRYLRGIDGQLPGLSGDQAKENQQREQGQKTQLGQDTVAIEATEGLNQSDYLRRLAHQIKEDNTRWQREDGSGIRAIGLLGSDIYDKFMILRALRPQFPDAVFFTNNYDAHFERRDVWDDAHNLIIASPFGSTLPEIYSQQHIAPFRDNNQTSMYVGTLVATGRMKKEQAESLSWQPRIFEISRHGAYDLSDPWHVAGTIRDWFFAPGAIWKIIIIGLAILAMAALIRVSITLSGWPGGGTVLQRLKRALVSTTFWLVCGAPLIMFAVVLVAQYCGAEEPLAFFSGISIWPSEMLRLTALMLAIFFMLKASIDLRANARWIGGAFDFDPLPRTPFRWRDLGLGLEHWQMDESGKISTEEAWYAYLCRNKFWPRFIRIGVLFALYSVFTVTIFRLFPQPLPPARGELSLQFDTVVSILAATGMMILSFYVIDAIQVTRNFIHIFRRQATKWSPALIDRSWHLSPPLTEEELSRYHQIYLVAYRTQAVAPLIWYPLIVLTLLVIARSSLFDNWTWPASVILIYAIIAVWMLASAILLTQAARQLTKIALGDLRLGRFRQRGAENKQQAFDELIADIRELKNSAFVPLTQQPFVRAIILPSGGLGLLAIGQRLLDIF